MPLLLLQAVDYSVGGPMLLENVSLAIEAGEKIALIGRNGAGKSTLLKLIGGQLQPEGGRIIRPDTLKIAGLEQAIPNELPGRVFDVVASGLGTLGQWLAEYQRLTETGGYESETLSALQNKIESDGGWHVRSRIDEVLARLEIEGGQEFNRLSGGMKRRALLAKALVAKPDILLLDEPTNHLDIDSIQWLESFLQRWSGSLVFVTHDRRFLRTLATRIVDIDRGQVRSWPGDWENYLRRRDEVAHAESLENARFDKRLAQEEAWIRQGIKARRTRDEGRVRRLQSLRRERAQRRVSVGTAKMEAAQAEKSGRKVIEAENVVFAHGDQTLIDHFSTVIMRGDRIGIIGPNGSGKTTLLKVLLDELHPASGSVRLGTHLQIAYFDQQRATLREDWNAVENVAEGQEYIELNGRKKHVLSYLQDFLFTPERARAPITRLSGGERHRLLLARLFARPSNVLILDEPTNDLDMETLDLLEQLLIDYPGTLLLVSHDREFMDNVVTSTLVMEGQGRIGEYIGGYEDWLRQRLAPDLSPVSRSKNSCVSSSLPASPGSGARQRKLSYNERRELEHLPELIEQWEAQMHRMVEAMHQSDFYRQDIGVVTAHSERVAELQRQLEQAYDRWTELDTSSGCY